MTQKDKNTLNRLKTKQLSLGYDGKAIVANLNVTIPTEKITVLVGANGCGKSTLLQGLARLLKPLKGMVYLDSKAINKLSTKSVAKCLAMLSQSPIVPEGLTVRDLVARGRYPHQNWLQQWSQEDDRMVEEALKITAMTEMAGRSLESLSGGQRQRAWIAMTLAQDTEILLLDEPTTYLDLSHQIELLDLLHELNQDRGKTIAMVLHDLNLACRYADYLIAVKQGQIYAEGSPEEIMTVTMVRDVFNLDCQIIPDPLSGTPMCIPIGRKLKKFYSIKQ